MNIGADSTTEMISNEQAVANKACFQEGYLPVPLPYIAPESLQGLKIYLYNPPVYNLYKSLDLNFSRKDYNRLIDGGIETVYIPTSDHQAYYQAVSGHLDDILEDRKIIKQKKSDILYATTLSLANQLLTQPPGKKQIDQVRRLTAATVRYLFKDPRSFNHLFEISNHDFYTATHMTNVSTIMVAYANYLGIDDPDMLNDLGTGALLHDVGKMFIPQDLLNCKDKLTPEQILMIQSHVQKGVDHLSSVTDLSDNIIRMVAEHHEKNDGTGYPRHLLCDDISLIGKMTSMVDCYEAMTSVRPYRNHGLSTDEALEIIQGMAPHCFESELVESFSRFVMDSMNNRPAHDVSSEHNIKILKRLGLLNDRDNPSGRQFPRYYLRVRSTLSIMHKNNGKWTTGPEEIVIVHNMSQGGMGILSPKALSKNAIVRIRIASRQLDRHVDYLATVVRVVNHADGWYTLGTRFLQSQTSDHIQTLYQTLK